MAAATGPARSALKLQADQYAALLATSSDGFWLFDTDGKLLDVNDSYCRMSGYSREELLKLHIPDIEAIETPGETAEHIRTLMKSGFDRFESRHRKKDGGIMDVEISVSFRRATNQFLLFVRDITGRKQAEAELENHRLHLDQLVQDRTRQLATINAQLQEEIGERKRAEEERARLLALAQQHDAETEAVFAAMQDAVLIYDTDMKVRRVNPMFIPTYGYDPVGLDVREIMQRNQVRWLDGRPFRFEEQPTPRALRGESVHGLCFLITRQDGTEMALECSSGPLRVGDRIIGSVTVWHDITERMRAEEKIRKQRQAILQLSTPVLPLADRMLVLPLIGVVDAQRAAQLAQQLLAAVRRHRAKVVVLDVTGVALIDSDVAGRLIHIVEAARLLGAITILTGISTSVAHTLTAVGVDLGKLRTMVDLQSGVEEAKLMLAGGIGPKGRPKARQGGPATHLADTRNLT